MRIIGKWIKEASNHGKIVIGVINFEMNEWERHWREYINQEKIWWWKMVDLLDPLVVPNFIFYSVYVWYPWKIFETERKMLRKTLIYIPIVKRLVIKKKTNKIGDFTSSDKNNLEWTIINAIKMMFSFIRHGVLYVPFFHKYSCISKILSFKEVICSH